ncbi:MAG: efflux system, rane fusion protein CmeA [Burkholderiaceae bacterium]|nr:efflux system, rane fusion protein CmeA [Burkholderiaceae bacterium]
MTQKIIKAKRHIGRSKTIATATVGILMLMALGGCGKSTDPAGAQAPAPVVGVVTVEPATVTLDTELSGRLQAIRQAQVVARATGVVQKRLFTEGSYVKQGQPLFQIDNAPYVANLETAQASLATAQANLAKANADVTRYRPLVQANAISKQEFDAAIAQQRLANAQVKSANAAIKTAKINVGYAYVTAPISGHIGKALVTEGALVSQTTGTPLALIQQTDTLYVDLSQSAATVLKLRQAMANGQLQTIEGQVPVTIVLEDGTEYPEKGRLLFTDLTVDENTGQVSLRAEIPNASNLLMPGMYVQVKIPQAQVNNAVLIPQQAVTRGTTGDTVMVVNADGSYAPKTITIAQSQGNNWVVTGGLNAGDQVIVDGMSAVQMVGAKKVQAKPWQPESSQNPAPSTPAAERGKTESGSSAKSAEQK